MSNTSVTWLLGPVIAKSIDRKSAIWQKRLILNIRKKITSLLCYYLQIDKSNYISYWTNKTSRWASSATDPWIETVIVLRATKLKIDIVQTHFVYTPIIHGHGKLHIRGQGLEYRKNKPSSNGCRRAVVSASTSLVIWIFAPELHGVLCKISDKQQRTFERSGADRGKSGRKGKGRTGGRSDPYPWAASGAGGSPG